MEEVNAKSTAGNAVEGVLGGKLWRVGRTGTTNPRDRQEMSGNHEEVNAKITAGNAVEGVLGGTQETSLGMEYRQQDG